MGDLTDRDPNYDDEDLSTYSPQDALGRSARSALLTGAAGLFIASVQNSMAKQQIGAFGVFTRFGRTVGVMSTMRTNSRVHRIRFLTVISGDGRSLPVFQHRLGQLT